MDNDMIIKTITEISTKQDSQEKTIDKLEGKVEELSKMSTSIALLACSVDELKNTVNDFKSTVSNLNNKVEKTEIDISGSPTKEKAKLWDFVVQYIIMGVVGLVMGYIGIRLGAK